MVKSSHSLHYYQIRLIKNIFGSKQGPRTGPFDSRGSRDGGGPIYLVSVRMRGGLTRSTANAD